MAVPLLAPSVIRAVTFTALFGMVLGAVFGYLASLIAPELFRHGIVASTALDPTGTAVVLGAIAGVLCGGCLGAFAVAIQAFGMWLDVRNKNRSA